MSSRFVSGGAIDSKTGESVPVASAPTSATNTNKTEEWAAVQSQLESERQERAARAKAMQETGEEKSLYDILQANKAAKQAAFEEANKIKNQFRALDDDEIDFLDEVERKKREEQERVRLETEEGLRLFREAQRGVGGGEAEAEGEGEGEEVVEGGWALGRKRKRRKGEAEGGGLLKGVKRSLSTGDGAGAGVGKDEKRYGEQKTGEKTPTGVTKEEAKAVAVQQPPKKTAVAAPAVPSKPRAGLVDYGSDDDSD